MEEVKKEKELVFWSMIDRKTLKPIDMLVFTRKFANISYDSDNTNQKIIVDFTDELKRFCESEVNNLNDTPATSSYYAGKREVCMIVLMRCAGLLDKLAMAQKHMEFNELHLLAEMESKALELKKEEEERFAKELTGMKVQN